MRQRHPHSQVRLQLQGEVQLPGGPDLLPEDLRDRKGYPLRFSGVKATAGTDGEEGVHAMFHRTTRFGRTGSTHWNNFIIPFCFEFTYSTAPCNAYLTDKIIYTNCTTTSNRDMIYHLC
jgi:hypothetical protein